MHIGQLACAVLDDEPIQHGLHHALFVIGKRGQRIFAFETCWILQAVKWSENICVLGVLHPAGGAENVP